MIEAAGEGPEDAGGDDVVAALQRAATWLHRDRFVPVTAPWSGTVASRDGAVPTCEAHGVPHTGKLARSIILDLAVHDHVVRTATASGPPSLVAARAMGEGAWRRALARASWVVSRLGTDPDHGGRIFLPGRRDPRNASTSLIDAGECVDALATIALHPRFRADAGVSDADREAVIGAIRECAETYLADTVASKAIVNQVLWGAMGLAHACSVFPDERRWREAVVLAVALGLDRQRPDGSWGYEYSENKEASAQTHPGVADLTVYYHGRCLAFLRHAIDHVPEADAGGRASLALRRGVAFLMAVRAGDGTKSLALEGKRWFWASTQEAGSLAYDIFALVQEARAATPTDASTDEGLVDAGLIEAARASWHTLRARIDLAGAVRAGDGVWPLGDAADVVCRDFHVADLAWVARSIEALRAGFPTRQRREAEGRMPEQRDARGPRSPRVRRFDEAGVVRLEVEDAVAMLRVAKSPNNAQWGGAVGGGTIVATGVGASEWRDAAVTPGSVTVCPVPPRGAGVLWRGRSALAGARRFLAANRLGREGRQAAFNLRVVARAAGRHLLHGHPIAGARLLIGVAVLAWRTVAVPFGEALCDVATTHWATGVTDDATLELSPVGGMPIAGWSGDVVPARRDGSVPEWGRGVRVVRRVRVDALGVQVLDRIEVDPPSGAMCVQVALPAGAEVVRTRRVRDRGPSEELGAEWRVWQGGAMVRAEVRPRADGDGRRPEDGMNDGTLEVAYRLDGTA